MAIKHPSIIDIELTNICNQACSFCLRPFMSRPVGQMPLKLFKQIMDEIATFTFPQWGKVVFAGFGEPTLHPDFIEMTNYAAAKNLPLIIYTNCTNLEPDIRQALLAPGIRDVKLSLNVHGQDMLTSVTGRNISWEEVVRNILDLFREHGRSQNPPAITLQLLYTGNLSNAVRHNETQILDTHAQADQALHFWQKEVSSLANPTAVPLKKDDPGSFKVGQVVSLLPGIQIKLCSYLPYRTHFMLARNFPSGLDFSSCRRHSNNLVIFQDGTVTPCCTDVNCQMELGNVHQQTLTDIYNGPTASNNRRLWSSGEYPHDLCRKCVKG